jgi:hypothetical protein
MSTIIAGRFDAMKQARRALREFARRGFEPSEYACYEDGPPARHRSFPIGGEAGAEAARAVAGGAIGGAIGGATGLAVGSIAGPLGAAAGAAVGACVGSLAGTMSPIGAPGKETDAAEPAAERHEGPMVAVCTDRPGTEAAAIAVLGASGAREIERAEGDWRDGGWADYDPASPTETLKSTPATGEVQAAEPKES